jgi:hypothetical protein
VSEFERRLREKIERLDALAAKADGMDRAERHADPHWMRTMLILGVEVAKRRPKFIAPDIERMRRELHPNVTTHEPRAMGPVMTNLHSLGVCEPTDEFKGSGHKSDHNNLSRIWASKIYEGPVRVGRRLIDPRQLELL